MEKVKGGEKSTFSPVTVAWGHNAQNLTHRLNSSCRLWNLQGTTPTRTFFPQHTLQLRAHIGSVI